MNKIILLWLLLTIALVSGSYVYVSRSATLKQMEQPIQKDAVLPQEIPVDVTPSLLFF